MARPAEPVNLKGISVVGMVHLDFLSPAALLAGTRNQFAAAFIDASIGSRGVFHPLICIQRVRFSPFSHIGGMVIHIKPIEI